MKKQESLELEESSTESWATTDDELNMCEELFAAIINATDQDRPLYPVFQLLPSKKVCEVNMLRSCYFQFGGKIIQRNYHSP